MTFFGAHPGEIPAWPRETGDKPALDWIDDVNEDNGDSGGRVLGSPGAGSCSSQDQRHRKADQFSRVVGDLVEVLCLAVLQGDMLALDVPEVTQSLPEDLDAGREARGGAGNEKTYPGDFPCWLRFCDK
jgi:hypothetical protein